MKASRSKCIEFRSMYVTAPKYDRSPESKEDPRITPVGRFHPQD